MLSSAHILWLERSEFENKTGYKIWFSIRSFAIIKLFCFFPHQCCVVCCCSTIIWYPFVFAQDSNSCKHILNRLFLRTYNQINKKKIIILMTDYNFVRNMFLLDKISVGIFDLEKKSLSNIQNQNLLSSVCFPIFTRLRFAISITIFPYSLHVCFQFLFICTFYVTSQCVLTMYVFLSKTLITMNGSHNCFLLSI